jgi:2'-5' RNA ligase
VKWVEHTGIHLTLKFLGNINTDKISEITDAMKDAAQTIPPFCLEVEELGAFPNLKRVQVIWVGLGGELDKVGQLQQQIEFNLECLGFAAETRPFAPHLTLGRVREEVPLEERQKLGELIASTKFEADAIRVDAVSLMQSQLTRQGAIYSEISQVKLQGNS